MLKIFTLILNFHFINNLVSVLTFLFALTYSHDSSLSFLLLKFLIQTSNSIEELNLLKTHHNYMLLGLKIFQHSQRNIPSQMCQWTFDWCSFEDRTCRLIFWCTFVSFLNKSIFRHLNEWIEYKYEKFDYLSYLALIWCLACVNSWKVSSICAYPQWPRQMHASICRNFDTQSMFLLCPQLQLLHSHFSKLKEKKYLVHRVKT